MARHRAGRDPRRGAEPFLLWRTVGRDLIGCGWLALASLGIGLATNALRAQPLSLRYRSPAARLEETMTRMPTVLPSSSPVGWRVVSLDEFQALVSAHEAISVDARPQAFYTVGHVPGALNLPRDDFEQNFAAVRASLEFDAARRIIVYCDEADCRDSELVAEALSRLGFRNLGIFKAGWAEWQRAGLPVESSSAE